MASNQRLSSYYREDNGLQNKTAGFPELQSFSFSVSVRLFTFRGLGTNVRIRHRFRCSSVPQRCCIRIISGKLIARSPFDDMIKGLHLDEVFLVFWSLCELLGDMSHWLFHTHSHTDGCYIKCLTAHQYWSYSHTDDYAREGSLVFSVLPQDTLTGRLQELESKPALWPSDYNIKILKFNIQVKSLKIDDDEFVK